MSIKYSDSELLELIRYDDASRARAITYIYNKNNYLIYWSKQILVKKIVAKAALEEAKDIYHVAIVILIEKIQTKEFIFQSSIKHYLKGIVQNLCRRNLQKQQKKSTLDLLVDDVQTTKFNQPIFNEWQTCVEEALGTLREKCRRILRLRMLQYSFKEIANIMGYENATTVRVTHQRCCKSLNNNIRSNANLHKKVEELLKK